MIAIDPGALGGIAWVDIDGIVQAVKMPTGMTEQADFILSIKMTNYGKAVIEKVGGYQPGNSGPASAKFARHCGNLEAILYCYGIPTEQVAPQVWQKALGSMPKDKNKRKNAIKEMMGRLYPHLKVTLSTADALGMLTWYKGRK